MKHRIISIILLLIFTTLPVYSSGQKTQEAATKVEKISLMIHPTLYKATGAEGGVVTDFAKESGIEVEVVTYSTTELHEKLVLEYTAKTGRYDVATIAVPYFNSELANFLEPMDDRIAKLPADHEFDRLIGVSRAKFPPPDGAVHALPFRMGTTMLYYNKEILSKAGISVPKTFDEYLAAGKRITSSDVIGILFRAKGAYMSHETFMRWLSAHGGDLLSPDMSKCVLNSPAATKALEDLVSVKKNGWGPPDALAFARDDEIRAMQTGKGAMVITFSPYWGLINKEGESEVIGKLGWSLVPTSPGIPPGKSQNTGWYVAIDKSSKAKNEAWELCKWMTNPKNQLIMARDFNNGPTQGSVYESADYLKKFPLAVDWLKGLELSVYPPPHPRHSEIQDIVGGEVQAALQGDRSPAEAMMKAYNDVTKVIK
jgi:ABC-type glycerol-3-phosphate transport system substrate-binding protein